MVCTGRRVLVRAHELDDGVNVLGSLRVAMGSPAAA